MSGHGWSPWMRFVAFIGVPSAIAIGLLYFLTQVVVVQLANINITNDLLAQDIQSAREIQTRITALTEQITELRRRQETEITYLRAICINGAGTTDERQRCLMP